ncbi:hypothetical protein ACDN41_25820 [Priestia aryabhattai]|uniref:hypothetical protein n=1 Tax=Priestia aryabhattai TaxID=412384 RepID=UPI003532448A
MPNLVEAIREKTITNTLGLKSFHKVFSTLWKSQIVSLITGPSGKYEDKRIFNLGDQLSSIFLSSRGTGKGGHATTSSVNSMFVNAGNSWECLLNWYLNLCLAGTRAVSIKYTNKLIPQSIKDSLTVNYGTHNSSSETDLIVLVFPDKPEYTTIDYKRLRLTGGGLTTFPSSKGRLPGLQKLLDTLGERDFEDFEVGIIQCKTNWNDLAQIPMLWDMIYASRIFARTSGITVGTCGKHIKDLAAFSYSYVTVPTNHHGTYNPNKLCVKRVQNLSGGNYWGHPSRDKIAHSFKEILNKNFINSYPPRTSVISHISTSVIPNLNGCYKYFNI